MRLEEITIEVPVITVEEFETISEDQLERIKELRKKLSQYNSMLHTLKKHYYGTSAYPGSRRDNNKYEQI